MTTDKIPRMYASVLRNRETPVKRMVRAFRGRFEGVYGTRFPRWSETSEIEKLQKRPNTVPTESVQDKLLLTGKLPFHSEPETDTCGLALLEHEKASAENSVHISRPVIGHMQEIVRATRKLERLQRRFRKYDMRNMVDGQRVEDAYVEQLKDHTNTEDKERLAKRTADLEKAFLGSSSFKKNIADAIDTAEFDLRIARDCLARELRKLLLLSNVLEDREQILDDSDDDLGISDHQSTGKASESAADDASPDESDPEEQAKLEATENLDQAKNHMALFGYELTVTKISTTMISKDILQRSRADNATLHEQNLTSLRSLICRTSRKDYVERSKHTKRLLIMR